mmetsp:Transcript_12619/g.18884  ORF Transcript_12619/g.18884 Transcript_12619/m.18884 type:complete len:461 (+) Transcript_12619:103-1485(+)|eukprot:CAMPEP_0167755672 /NCGR_PEP_ID=MMETSP0110_2-20121227/8959_1 /TAXON_ID=629695 /ORGANISM="Gymnochlora sp., Strain CCMP2014" /LENGTH=460 /DNA_ID=CAMNT_0007641695 /DNA_START=19 /DNA_END=1401 /DNA_ORIENTATION=-
MDTKTPVDDGSAVEDTIEAHTSSWSVKEKEIFKFYEEERKQFETIQPGAKVVIKFADGRQTFAKIKAGKRARFGKGYYNVDKLLGKPYGPAMDVDRGNFTLVQFDYKEDISNDGDKDNAKLNDSHSNQGLSMSEIEKLKKKKTSGENLVEAVVSNSKTFEAKTEFSKAKYIKKKRKKYLNRVSILPANAAAVCDAYLKNEPKRSLNLRPDTLSIMLTASNARAHGKTVIFDSTSGVLAAGVVERHGGFGRILNIFMGERSRTEAIDSCNFPKRWTRCMWNFPLGVVVQMNRERREAALKAAENAAEAEAHTPRDSSGAAGTLNFGSDPIEGDKEGKVNEEVSEKREKLRTSFPRVRVILKEPSDSLLIATKYHPVPILKEILPYMSGSSQIVIYSEYMEPLKAAAQYLKNGGQVVNLNILESWNREYQILPKRTHPLMNMHGFSGYLLTATKLAHPSDIP